MGVIVELSVEATDFELGQLLDVTRGGRIELASVVPTGESLAPLFWLVDADRESFEARLGDHADVADLVVIETFPERALYAADWAIPSDSFLTAVRACDGHVLHANGHSERWYFAVTFPARDDLSAFSERLTAEAVDFSVTRVATPDEPGAAPWFGLTAEQHEALTLAVEVGYYDIPRQVTTIELADRLGISDQAATERLRRASVNLVSNTLSLAEESSW